MSMAPLYQGVVRMPYAMKYILVHAEGGTVEAQFVNKTLCDKCCNELNATIGQGKEIWQVRKIFIPKEEHYAYKSI